MDVTELTDHLLISHTLAVYCDHVDRSDLLALLELFTEDVVLDMGHDAVFTGREQLREVLIDRVGYWTYTSHHSSNVIVTRYTPTQVSVTSYVFVFHDHPGRDEAMQLWGRYEDELVKVDGAWRIRVRRLRVAGVLETDSPAAPERFQRFAREALPTNRESRAPTP